jgi:hypothetical protein
LKTTRNCQESLKMSYENGPKTKSNRKLIGIRPNQRTINTIHSESLPNYNG